jgi:RecA-family ATPase
MNLLNLESCYLSCLLNGAGTHEITLSMENEMIHKEIKRLKNKGFVNIPKGIISGTENLNYDEDRRSVNFYAEEIIELQKRAALQKATEGVKRGCSTNEIIYDLRQELDKIAQQTEKTEIVTAHELQKKDYRNVEFIVEKILPVGMAVLMGAPKMGKSWLLLLWADCIVNGFPIFGHKVKKVPVLYYTLEDSVKRCKFRLNKLNNPNIAWSDNLFCTEKHNGTIGIVNDVKLTGAKVVIIDTFGAFAPVKDGNDYYETTRIFREIKEIADTLQIVVLVVHHTRKKEKESDDWTADIMGSQGLVGAADTLISLIRKRNEDKARLFITGRDVSDSRINIKINDCCWESDYDE